MTVKFEPNIGEKFYVARYLNPNFDNVCNNCNNTGHSKKINLYQKHNSFNSTFEYYVYEVCSTCNITTNTLVPIKNNTTYRADFMEFILNSDGFRSTEFTKEHDGKHVLFVGCSNTFGMGMQFENTWAHRIYSKMAEKEKLSGYYNLGHIGAKITESITNIFLYCKKYAKPNVIFFLMPTIGRELSPNQDVLTYKNDSEIFMNFVFKKQQVIDMYMMLEEYCKANNIILISKSWDATYGELSVNDTLNIFSTFHQHDVDLFHDLVIDYCDANPKDPYAMKAADNLHAGNALMYADSEILYNIYKESL